MFAPPEPRRGQRLSLCWGSVEGAGLIDLAVLASGAGMTAIAVTPRQHRELAEGGMAPADMRRRLTDLGIRVSVVDPLIEPIPGTPAPRDVPEAMRWLFEPDCEQVWRAAEELEAETINMTAFLGQPVPADRMRDALAELTARNADRGFASTIEFIPGTSIPDLPNAAALAVDAPGLRIMLDAWHWARSSGTLADIDALPPGMIGGVQLNDWLPPEPGAPYVPMSGRLLPGDGCLQLVEMLAAVERNSPGLDVGIELFNADLGRMDRTASVALMAERCAGLLAR